MHYDMTNSQVVALGILMIWDLYWRGMALWRAAQTKNRNWFIVLLVINSAGILPIIYLYNTKAADHKQ